MRTAETKATTSVNRNQTANPFFQMGNEGVFFSSTKADIQTKPFFDARGLSFEQGSAHAGHKNSTGPSVQTKVISIGMPDDRYEKEADKVADHVVQKLVSPEAVQTDEETEEKVIGDLDILKKPAIETDMLREKRQSEQVHRAAADTPDIPSLITPDAVGKVKSDHSSASVPAVQSKCMECALEDKLQKKEGEEEDEHPVISAKAETSDPVDTHNLQQQLSQTKGGGSTLAECTRTPMEDAFGTGFSGVKVHTGSHAVQMNKELHAQAFTHGSDIYFNEGKYSPASNEGRHLLAHELTHVIQQGGSDHSDAGNNPGQISKKSSVNADGFIQRLGFKDLKYASPLYWNYRVTRWVGGKAWEGLQGISEQGLASVHLLSPFVMNLGKDEFYDIRGKTSFNPGVHMWIYILNYFESNRTNRAPVKIKYGSLGGGTIIVEADSSYNFSTTGNFLIGIDHPAFKVDTKQQALALDISISNNKISGEIGVARDRSGDEMRAKKDMPFINYGGFKNRDLHNAVLGESYDGENFGVVVSNNSLVGGIILYQLGGFLDIQHQHKLLCILSIMDDQYDWLGELESKIKGTDAYTLNVGRTPGGLLSAESDEMKLDSRWIGEGFTLDGALRVVYSNKTIEIYGTAAYKSRRAEGSVTLAVLPEPKAQQLFIQHVPAVRTEDSAANIPGEDKGYPNDVLALTAWGDFRFKLIDKAKTLTGDASFAVSPDGYIVTAGQVKLQKDFILMDALARNYTLFEDEMSTKIYIGGVPVKLSLRGDIKAGYRIGPVAMYELMAGGTYSNHPKYASELCLSAKFEMPANMYIQLNLIAAAGINVGYKYLSITIVEVGGKLTARSDLNAYVNARPTIGIRREKDDEPEYCLSGKLYAGGELIVNLDTGLEISVFRKIKTDSGGEEKKPVAKKDSFASWSIGDFGFELGLDYTLGSSEKPEFTYSGGKFDKTGFLRALRRKGSKGKTSEPGPKGGFIQEGDQKGSVSEESIRDKEISEAGQPLGPFEIVEDFKMNGTSHKLFLVVSGTEGDPEIRIDMASDRDDLIKKIDEEITTLEKVRTSVLLILSGELTEDRLKKIQLSINRLMRIREKTEKVIASVTAKIDDPASPSDIAAPGFNTLDDEIGEFGDQFGVNDLGDKSGGSNDPGAVTEISTDKPPSGMEVILVLPPQKAVHLRLYRNMADKGLLQHRVEREDRDTNQQNVWDDNLQAGMPRGTFCQGRGFGLSVADIFRPYWSKQYLDASRKSRKKPRESSDIPRMQVDHVIEWQVRPLAGAAWLDQPWNFELMDASSNGSSGPKMRGNINKERSRLAKETGDEGWNTKDITFTRITVEGSGDAERWGFEEIEDGDHLDMYRILTGEIIDPEKEKTC